MAVKTLIFLPFTSDPIISLLCVISSKPTSEFITALIHLTHSICSRASVNRLCLFPDDKDDRLSSKQSIPPRIRNSLSHSLLAFSRRGLIPEKFFKDGVFNNFTHSSGSASAISSLSTEETAFFSPEIFRQFEILLRAIFEFIRRRDSVQRLWFLDDVSFQFFSMPEKKSQLQKAQLKAMAPDEQASKLISLLRKATAHVSILSILGNIQAKALAIQGIRFFLHFWLGMFTTQSRRIVEGLDEIPWEMFICSLALS